MSAREAVLEELDAAVSAPSDAAVVSGAPTCSVALLGQPNSGKSTLFNALTGSRQRVGNWPGKTVEKKEGGFSRGGVDYAVCDLPGTYSLSANSEEEVVTRDYIASPKPNGSRSLHLIVQVPVFLSEGKLILPVEVQIRTIAMDFWASLEHQLRYKETAHVPEELNRQLLDAANRIAALDGDMQHIHDQMAALANRIGDLK